MSFLCFFTLLPTGKRPAPCWGGELGKFPRSGKIFPVRSPNMAFAQWCPPVRSEAKPGGRHWRRRALARWYAMRSAATYGVPSLRYPMADDRRLGAVAGVAAQPFIFYLDKTTMPSILVKWDSLSVAIFISFAKAVAPINKSANPIIWPVVFNFLWISMAFWFAWSV